MTEESARLHAHIGRMIKNARTKKKISQEKLGESVKLTRTSITNIEKGRHRILLDTLWQISNILDVTLLELLPKQSNEKIPLDKILPKHISNDERNWIKEVIEDEQK